MTLREIANLLGVSPATVSLVLNGRDGVNEATRKRVQDALQKYHYAKKTCTPKRIDTIYVVKYTVHGMIVEENQGFISSILDQITQDCLVEGIKIQMAVCNQSTLMEIIRTINKSDAQGVIWIGTEMDESASELLREIVIPLVVVDNNFLHKNIDCVLMANMDIGITATRYLIEDCGYQKIGHLRSSIEIANFYWRKIGYEYALKKCKAIRGISIPLTPTLERAYDDMCDYLRNGTEELPKAFFADNDTIAVGAIRALVEFGYRVPDDISVIGVDNIPYSAVCTPALTTVSISRKEIGNQALNLLMQRILNGTEPPVRVEIQGELLERKSTKKNPG